MYNDAWKDLSNSSVYKFQLFKKNPTGYFLSSILAGMFIGFGILLTFSIGGFLEGRPEKKIVMGACFAIALSLVMICGAELFTGNNLIIGSGVLDKRISLKNAIKISIFCFIGNWVGSIIISLLFHLTGLNTASVANLFQSASQAKMSGDFISLFVKGILCNILVCLAIWSGFRTKNDTAKLIMIWWCLFAFITSGFEHSIANMSVLTIGLLNNHSAALSFSGYFYNIFVVTLGNILGGVIFVTIPYFIIKKEK